jgi:hypothetical protein
MGTVSAAIELLTALLTEAAKISTLVQTAQASGQTTLPTDAWAQIVGADTDAETALTNAIAKAQGA